MKKGDVINGYTILQDFSTVGGGLSKWSFAKKSGEEFFIKEFLSPIFPSDGSPGGARTKADKRKKCELFENHHEELGRKIAPACADGGNLIATKDFFRAGTKYYKVTEKVDVSGLSPADIAGLDVEKKMIILKTVCHSLGVLHSVGIVHGDLKPDNILIKQTLTGNYTAKLIDFDNSYVAGKPPLLLEEVVGDMVFYSPELALYVQRSDSVRPTDLDLKSDIFALGLIYHQYWTGRLPLFDATKYAYAHQAVLAGEKLGADVRGSEFLQSLLGEMLSAEPAKRPSVREVFDRLKGGGKDKTTGTEVSTGRLKIKMSGEKRTHELPKEKMSTGKLRINMGTKKSESDL